MFHKMFVREDYFWLFYSILWFAYILKDYIIASFKNTILVAKRQNWHAKAKNNPSFELKQSVQSCQLKTDFEIYWKSQLNELGTKLMAWLY